MKQVFFSDHPWLTCSCHWCARCLFVIQLTRHAWKNWRATEDLKPIRQPYKHRQRTKAWINLRWSAPEFDAGGRTHEDDCRLQAGAALRAIPIVIAHAQLTTALQTKWECGTARWRQQVRIAPTRWNFTRPSILSAFILANFINLACGDLSSLSSSFHYHYQLIYFHRGTPRSKRKYATRLTAPILIQGYNYPINKQVN